MLDMEVVAGHPCSNLVLNARDGHRGRSGRDHGSRLSAVQEHGFDIEVSDTGARLFRGGPAARARPVLHIEGRRRGPALGLTMVFMTRFKAGGRGRWRLRVTAKTAAPCVEPWRCRPMRPAGPKARPPPRACFGRRIPARGTIFFPAAPPRFSRRLDPIWGHQGDRRPPPPKRPLAGPWPISPGIDWVAVRHSAGPGGRRRAAVADRGAPTGPAPCADDLSVRLRHVAPQGRRALAGCWRNPSNARALHALLSQEAAA